MTIAERSLMRCYQNLTPGETSTRPDFHSVAGEKNHHNGRINVGTGLTMIARAAVAEVGCVKNLKFR